MCVMEFWGIVKYRMIENSWMVPVCKEKRDALECGSYRGVKLLDHVMKVLERVIEVG